MILHAEGWQFAMPHTFNRTIIQIEMRNLQRIRERFFRDREAVVL